MKKRKLNLRSLEVKSFVTSINFSSEIKGGVLSVNDDNSDGGGLCPQETRHISCDVTNGYTVVCTSADCLTQ